jgi:ribosomal protein L35
MEPPKSMLSPKIRETVDSLKPKEEDYIKINPFYKKPVSPKQKLTPKVQTLPEVLTKLEFRPQIVPARRIKVVGVHDYVKKHMDKSHLLNTKPKQTERREFLKRLLEEESNEREEPISPLESLTEVKNENLKKLSKEGENLLKTKMAVPMDQRQFKWTKRNFKIAGKRENSLCHWEKEGEGSMRTEIFNNMNCKSEVIRHYNDREYYEAGIDLLISS